MVKFYENSFTYDYSFPTVTLAYFLRYPNPYSRHVISTDVISRHVDAEGRLHTTRLHLKRSKLPKPIIKLLPKSLMGSDKENGSQSYILEESVVDVKDGSMLSTSRNLEWTGVLSVVEQQLFKRPISISQYEAEGTNVTTTVTLLSRLGQARLFGNRQRQTDENAEPKQGFFRSLSTSSIQRSIESIGAHRAKEQLTKSREGMKLVLERLRHGGLVEVVDGMRRDRESALISSWKH